ALGGVLGGQGVDLHELVVGGAVHCRLDIRGGHVEQPGGSLDEHVLRQVHVALVGGVVQRVDEPRFQPGGVVVRQAEVAGDLVGGDEADTVHVAGEPVRVG